MKKEHSRREHNRERINLRLIEHIIDGDERKHVGSSYLATKDILDQTLRRVVKKKLDDSIEDDEDPEKYNCANWRDRDADQFGYRRALREVLNLLP